MQNNKCLKSENSKEILTIFLNKIKKCIMDILTHYNLKSCYQFQNPSGLR